MERVTGGEEDKGRRVRGGRERVTGGEDGESRESEGRGRYRWRE